MPTLPGAWNFRDVAENTGIRPGVFYRSGELSSLADAGRAELTRMQITDVADLRSGSELLRHGAGLVPDGVEIHHLPFVETVAPGGDAPHEHAFQQMMTEKPEGEPVGDAAARYMKEEYDRIARSRLAQRAVHRMVTLLGQQRRVLAHCFAGKDRTGFTIAVVLETAGVDRDAIMRDYLASNAAVPELRAAILENVRNRGGESNDVFELAEARLTDEVLGVRPQYLEVARQAIDDEFGSLDNYLREAGVTPEQVEAVRTALT
ncbi:MAG: protein-tyrosine phosphatase [Mycobacterium sp.]|nr:protein-tyrosine phosphatase [Mycobacterium sp.]